MSPSVFAGITGRYDRDAAWRQLVHAASLSSVSWTSTAIFDTIKH
ncbi:hypothetical protein MITSMUL_03308 [Mitsuokella multacida DSM 20544]|uniref:Uncharacterized protein n=1 Tax=Mitsuokella multacida DSM 20544 TaxID=500635 RepID=C9KIQ7_9FIRM|nr:hypothetical protein MITSMUL_03308 [Mitsuokella multacida DSM 20544]